MPLGSNTSGHLFDTTFTTEGVLYSAANGVITSTASGSAGQILQSAGSASPPVYSTATLPSTATSTGTLLRADGTNWVATTSTYPNTNALNTILYASSANVMSALSTATNGVLITDGTTGIPSISSTLPSAVQGNITSVGTISSGTWNGTAVDVAHGGTGRATLTTHGVLVGNGTTAITQLSAGSAGQVLQSGGASSDPTYSTATFPSTATGTGTILRADGTNWIASTNTYPNTATTGDILIATGSNVIGSLADVAVGQVLVSGGVSTAPAYSASPTVTSITFGSGNALNTYATSTWTPSLALATPGNSSFTYAQQIGYYIKIGSLVFITVRIVLTNFTIGTGSGQVSIGTLPFTAGSTANQNYNLSCMMQNTTVGSGVLYYQGNIQASGTTIIIAGFVSATTQLNLAAGSLSNTTIIQITGCYSTT